MDAWHDLRATMVVATDSNVNELQNTCFGFQI